MTCEEKKNLILSIAVSISNGWDYYNKDIPGYSKRDLKMAITLNQGRLGGLAEIFGGKTKDKIYEYYSEFVLNKALEMTTVGQLEKIVEHIIDTGKAY